MYGVACATLCVHMCRGLELIRESVLQVYMAVCSYMYFLGLYLVCMCVHGCSACFPAHIFLFNIQLSGTEMFSKNARLRVKGERLGSSFREHLRDSRV